MRKKIGKRIGPVPITLAAFALAAVLSVGLLFAMNGNVTQAQGIPAAPTDNAASTGAEDCDVTVIDAMGDATNGSGVGCRL